jgi:DNA-binding FrmR family transcriptional regulator
MAAEPAEDTGEPGRSGLREAFPCRKYPMGVYSPPLAESVEEGRMDAVSDRPTGGSGCGCGGAETCHAGPGGLAHGVDERIKAANLRQLRRIEGQVRGIAAMVEQDRYCADVITQVSAVRASLHSVARNLLRNHLAHCAAAALHEEGPDREAMIDELLDLVGRLGR